MSTRFIIALIIVFFTFSVSLKAQNCTEFYKEGECQTKYIDNYKLSGLSKNYYLEIGKTVTYEVVLYGEFEIRIQCCTNEDYNPIRFKIKSSENGNIIYDNKYNNYINNLNLLLDHTELMSIEISVEPKKKKLKNDKVCIGMAIYFEK